MKKILITGCLGHIGSYLMENKNFNKHRLVGLDNLLTQRYCSLFNLKRKKKNIEFIYTDILEKNFIKYVKEADILIHLAAITDAESSVNKKKEVDLVNFKSFKKIVGYCSKFNTKIIFPSTTSVYGTQKNFVDENCSESDLNPQSPYAKSKLDSEKFMIKYSQKNKLKFVILRLGTIYGVSKGMRFHTAINKFCWQSSLGMPITIWRTAMNQKRPYLSLNDASRSFLHIINNDLFDKNIYNIVTENLSINNIVKILKKNNKNLKIKYVDSKIMNQLSYEVSNLKFKNTKFRFKGSITNGISKTLELIC